MTAPVKFGSMIIPSIPTGITFLQSIFVSKLNSIKEVLTFFFCVYFTYYLLFNFSVYCFICLDKESNHFSNKSNCSSKCKEDDRYTGESLIASYIVNNVV